MPQPVRRVSPTSPNSAAITSSMLPIPMRRVIPDRRTGSELLRLPRTVQPMRRVSRTVQTNAASPLMHPRTVGEYLLLPRILRRTVLRTKTAQHSPSVMRVSKYNGLRAHTHASTRRLCRPCLCFFYNFFINIILFYYWVTNRDLIDLFCHPLRPVLSPPQTYFVTPSDRLLCSHYDHFCHPLRSALQFAYWPANHS